MKRQVRPLAQSGFTLIEILVALALLGLIMVVILTPMLGLFKFSRTTEDILDINMVVQQRLEEARALVQSNYDTPANFRARLETLGVSCKNVGLYGAELSGTCYDSAAGSPPLRRLSVTATQSGKSVTATVDVTK